jgi:hypothetical protein
MDDDDNLQKEKEEEEEEDDVRYEDNDTANHQNAHDDDHPDEQLVTIIALQAQLFLCQGFLIRQPHGPFRFGEREPGRGGPCGTLPFYIRMAEVPLMDIMMSKTRRKR